MSDNKTYTTEVEDVQYPNLRYKTVNWEDNVTPLNAANLNQMDLGIVQALLNCYDNALKVSTLSKKVEDINSDVSEVSDSVADVTSKIKKIEEESIPEIYQYFAKVVSDVDNSVKTVKFEPSTGSLVFRKTTTGE